MDVFGEALGVTRLLSRQQCRIGHVRVLAQDCLGLDVLSGELRLGAERAVGCGVRSNLVVDDLRRYRAQFLLAMVAVGTSCLWLVQVDYSTLDLSPLRCWSVRVHEHLMELFEGLSVVIGTKLHKVVIIEVLAFVMVHFDLSDVLASPLSLGLTLMAGQVFIIRNITKACSLPARITLSLAKGTHDPLIRVYLLEVPHV